MQIKMKAHELQNATTQNREVTDDAPRLIKIHFNVLKQKKTEQIQKNDNYFQKKTIDPYDKK